MRMPVHEYKRRQYLSLGVDCPTHYRDGAFDGVTTQQTALVFHGQTVERLAERGGIDFREAIALLKGAHYFDLWGWGVGCEATQKSVRSEFEALRDLGAWEGER